MKWEIPEKPATIAETRLIEAILDGRFPIESTLPAERELAKNLGVTRPTLREALQRMARDGWVEIQQGKSTRVKDFWRDGNLGVLSSIAQHPNYLPKDLIISILNIRFVLAPAYIKLAVSNSPEPVVNYLNSCLHIDDNAVDFSVADFELQRYLTIQSGNPIYTLILNGFKDLYLDVALKYFSFQIHRDHTRKYYQSLLESAKEHDAEKAAQLTELVMKESIDLWQRSRDRDGGR